MSKWRYTWTLSAPMISPSARWASSRASSDLPEAVGPTTTTMSSPSSTLSAADFALQLIPSQAGHDGPTMRAMTGKVDLVQGQKKRVHFFVRKPIARAHRAVTRHRGQHQI